MSEFEPVGYEEGLRASAEAALAIEIAVGLQAFVNWLYEGEMAAALINQIFDAGDEMFERMLLEAMDEEPDGTLN